MLRPNAFLVLFTLLFSFIFTQAAVLDHTKHPRAGGVENSAAEWLPAELVAMVAEYQSYIWRTTVWQPLVARVKEHKLGEVSKAVKANEPLPEAYRKELLNIAGAAAIGLLGEKEMQAVGILSLIRNMKVTKEEVFKSEGDEDGEVYTEFHDAILRGEPNQVKDLIKKHNKDGKRLSPELKQQLVSQASEVRKAENFYTGGKANMESIEEQLSRIRTT
ncbi:Uu.00g034670.m01.CDS01 [Anthostomella pinea]|uniref:Uu.00g034670.m01.CDS01 n=1 Tax=Anthostomella pinea TaxID=933095 RepID=A0AAI8V939_9PEZI|nr:Uu.00g034670.m01.CDS01 [Anthostomella pinea]